MNHKSALLWGLFVWVLPFVVAILIFPLRSNERPLFESIMPVALALAVVLGSIKYFGKSEKNSAWIGFCLGLIWLGLSLTLDALMFSWGPMKMSLMDYLKDIGVTYLMIPIITTAFGFLR